MANPTRQNFVDQHWADDAEKLLTQLEQFAIHNPWAAEHIANPDEQGERFRQMIKMRINRNNCLDDIASQLSEQNWDSLTPRMRRTLQDLVDVVRSINNS